MRSKRAWVGVMAYRTNLTRRTSRLVRLSYIVLDPLFSVVLPLSPAPAFPFLDEYAGVRRTMADLLRCRTGCIGRRLRRRVTRNPFVSAARDGRAARFHRRAACGGTYHRVSHFRSSFPFPSLPFVDRSRLETNLLTSLRNGRRSRAQG